MAKSRRNKIVTLSKTVKKGKESKQNLIEQIRQALDEHTSVYVFSVDNMRTELFQQARAELKGRCRFFVGKKSVMAKALGVTREDEQRENLHKISAKLNGDVGLLFAREAKMEAFGEDDQVISEEELKEYLDSLEQGDYARAGAEATETIAVPAGPLKTSDNLPVATNLEGQIRQCGLPVSLIRGVVVIPEGPDRVICSEGEKLTADQARLLKLLNYQMVTFKINLLCRYRDGDIIEFANEDVMEADE